MGLEEKIRLGHVELGSREWWRVLEHPYKKLTDDDFVLVPRFPELGGAYMTKKEYEAYRQRILSTPLK